MKITRMSEAGIERTKEIDVTQQQLDDYYIHGKRHDAFPHLSEKEREFIKTGLTPDEDREDEDLLYKLSLMDRRIKR